MVVVAVLIDLYFSLAIRTFYLNLANGGEMTVEEEKMHFAKLEQEKREQRKRMINKQREDQYLREQKIKDSQEEKLKKP